MKRSQVALLSVGGILAGIVIATVVSARIAMTYGVFTPGETDAVARAAEIRGVNEVEVDGTWRVNLSRGDHWRMDLSYPEGFRDRVGVQVVGDRLRLGSQSDSWLDEPDLRPIADIVMPELEELKVRGSAQLDLSGFKGRRLDIDVAGTAQLTGSDGRYEELELSVAGASDIDLSGVAVTDAEIDLAGASKVTLTMSGGTLSGFIAGAGSVEYYGWVSEKTVQIAGFARVEHVE